MPEEITSFEQFVGAIGHLGKDELLKLLNAVDELIPTTSSDSSYNDEVFRAEGSFFEVPSDQPIPLDEMLQLIQRFNPAELRVLSSLIPFYMDRARHTDGQLITVRWSTRSVGVLGTAPKGLSQADIEQREEAFKSLINLLHPAQEAKAAGDQQKALELLEQAMSLLKVHGISEFELQRLRDLFNK
jgi:hypothetical protein